MLRTLFEIHFWCMYETLLVIYMHSWYTFGTYSWHMVDAHLTVHGIW
jgi:hypothetical protein